MKRSGLDEADRQRRRVKRLSLLAALAVAAGTSLSWPRSSAAAGGGEGFCQRSGPGASVAASPRTSVARWLDRTAVLAPLDAAAAIVLMAHILAHRQTAMRQDALAGDATLTIATVYPAATAEAMEARVTQPFEEAIGALDGVQTVGSLTRAGVSRIAVVFRRGSRDAGGVTNRDRIARALQRLSAGDGRPIVAAPGADAEPSIHVVFASADRPLLEVTDYVDRYVKERLQRVAGVEEVQVLGARRRVLRIEVDRDRMAAFGLTAADVDEAVRALPAAVAASRVGELTWATPMADDGGERAATDLEEVVKVVNGAAIRLSDLARVEVGVEDDGIFFRVDGREVVALAITRRPTASFAQISQGVCDAYREIRPALPAGVEIEILAHLGLD